MLHRGARADRGSCAHRTVSWRIVLHRAASQQLTHADVSWCIMVHHAVSCRIGAHLTASGASDRIGPHRAASGRIGAPRARVVLHRVSRGRLFVLHPLAVRLGPELEVQLK